MAGHFVCKPKRIASARKKLADWQAAQKEDRAAAALQRRAWTKVQSLANRSMQ